jgi:hypothetical protein
MIPHEQIETEIRQLLATETRTTVLSNKLFQQGAGLFAQLATTEEERRELVKTELFRTAQARVRELQYRDAEALREAHRVLQERLPDTTDARLSLDFPTQAAS